MNEVISEDCIYPCYFFHGEEKYLSNQFVHKLKESLISPDVEDFNIEKFNLEDTSWADLIDQARTIPIFFMPWRIISIEIPMKGRIIPTSKDENIIRDYLSSPSLKSIMVIVYPGKLKKNHGLLKLFSSFPPQTVSVRESKPLNSRALDSWIDKRLSGRGKSITFEAKRRLEEINGNNLSHLENELEKLLAFVDDKKVIEIDDVNQVSGWAKTFAEYELSNSLEKGDFKQSVVVLNNLFREGIKPEVIFGIIARFFRDIFLAKLWLKERSKDRKEIFKAIKPQIQERFGNFYRTKFDEYFSVVESIQQKDLNSFLDDLGKIDLSVKTTSVSLQPLLESFLFEFCNLMRQKRLFGRRSVQ